MYALFDIGGTKTRVSVSKNGETLDAIEKFDTPTSFEEGIALLTEKIRTLAKGARLHAAAGGIAGVLNRAHAKVAAAPNLPQAWIDVPLKARLQEVLNIPVLLENDTALVGLGEAHNGAGRGFGIVAYITVSTGVGGVRIVCGKIDENYQGFEIGHQVIDISATVCKDCVPCPICKRVDLESMVSGSGVERRFHKKPYEIPQTDSLWSELAKTLAQGLHNTMLHWSPEIVVLGGSMIVGDPAILVPDIERELKEYLKIFPELPIIKRAELEDRGGLHGALAYVKMQPGL